MRRVSLKPRKNWEKIVEKEQGLTYNKSIHPGTGKTVNYWNEDHAYEFTYEEVDKLEKATEQAHEMYIEVAKFLAEEQKKSSSPFKQMFIPEYAVEYAIESLNRGDKDVYGRFDFAYVNNGNDPIIKILEYNNDTPTGLWEAAVMQWYRIQDITPEVDQWNSIHEALISRWAQLKVDRPTDLLHFAHTELDKTHEDLMTTSYMRDVAEQGGWHGSTIGLTMSEIGYHDNKFVDLQDNEITSIFKLYPWEYMVEEGFGEKICDLKPEGWYEPAWKMFTSTKVSLAALYHLYPNNELVLPAYLNHPHNMNDYVKKPVHGREGDGISIFLDNKSIVDSYTPEWGEEGFVYQEFFPLENHIGDHGESNYPILGSWVVNGESVGVGIRESDGLLTDYYCRFVPNIVV